jgi:hypothetical protein
MVLSDPTTAQPLLYQVKNLPSIRRSDSHELRYELPAGARAPVSLYSYMKRSFSIDVTRSIRIQPFLLIARTTRIVTVHSPVDSTDGY